MNSLVWVILDSCRYDSFVRAKTPRVRDLAAANGVEVERRWSYASWTAPAHYTFLMGMLPHLSPPGVFASEVYKHEFEAWTGRLGVDKLDFAKFLPQLSLPLVLKELGYRTVGRVSLPVLNQATLLSTHFDDYRLMDSHNDFGGMIAEMRFGSDKPAFYFLNLGETHYPYMLKDDSLPRVSGVHGVFRGLAQAQRLPSPAAPPPPGSGAGGESGGPAASPTAFFDPAQMRRLHEQQVRCVEHVDALLEGLFHKCPPGTHVIVTSDHGEMFGESNYFGHGPVMHEKVFEVPFIEGKVPRR